jgi:hypothetical protein
MSTIEESIIVSIVPWDDVFLSFSLMIPKLEAMGPHAWSIPSLMPTTPLAFVINNAMPQMYKTYCGA